MAKALMKVYSWIVEFAIYLLDYDQMKEKLNKGQLTWLLSKKAEVFVHNQDYHKAIDLYQQALDHDNESRGFAHNTREYETRIGERNKTRSVRG